MEQESQIKILQTQLGDYRAREEKSMTEKQEKFLEREDKLLKKLDEISNWQQPGPQIPLPLNQTSMVGNFNQHQASKCLLHPSEGYVPQNQSVTTYQPHFVGDSAEVPTSVRLHHMQPAPHPSLDNPATEAFHFNEQAPSYRQATSALGYQYHPQSNPPQSALRGQEDAVVPASAVNIPVQQNQQAVTHPTAAIAPIRPASNQQDQQPLGQQQGNITEPVISKGIDK